jgi:AsmA protein
MKAALRWGAIIIGGVLVVLVAAILLIPLFVDADKFKPLIEKRVIEATGRPVSVGEDLRLSLFPRVGITSSDLRLGNPPGFEEKDFVTVKSFEVRVKLLPLLRKDIQVQRFILNDPRIVLVKSKDGTGNWEMAQKPDDTGPKDKPTDTGGFELPIKALAVNDFAIRNGTVVWIDHKTGLHKEAADVNLRLKDVSLDQPIEISLSGRLDGKPLSLNGKVGPLGRQIGQGTIYMEIALAALEEFKCKLKGHVENPLSALHLDLAVDLDEFSPRKLLAAFGQPFPLATSDPNALSRLALAAKVRADKNNLEISDGTVELDDSVLNLTVKAADFSKPDVSFNITLDQINVDRYLPPKGETKTEQGKKTVKTTVPAGKPAPKTKAKPFNLATVAIDGRLKAGKVTLNKRDIQDIQLMVKGKNGPIKLALSARLKEGPVSVEGTVGPFGPKPGEGDVPLDLTVNAVNELKLKASGKITNPTTQPGADVALKVDEFSPRKLLAAFGQPFPLTTSDLKAVNRVAFSGRIKAGPTSLSVSDGKMILDESSLNLAFRAADLAKPDVGFDVTVDQINLDRYLPSPSKAEAGAQQTASGGKPSQKAETTQPASGRAATDYEPLRRLVIDGQLKAGKLTVNNMKLQDVLLKISGKNGVINLDPIKTNLYQGSFSGKGNLNVQEGPPKTGVSLTVSNIQVGPLLKDAAQKDFLEGIASAQMDLTMSGDTAETIKRTLTGKGQLKFNDGAVKGFDLASMARNVKAAFGLEAKGSARPRTDFSELDVPFTMTNGVAETPRAIMKGPFIRLEASGRANLAQETLDLRVEPKAVATMKGQGDETERSGILVPVLVTGTFNSPKFQPDLKSMIKQQVDKGVLESEPVKKIFEKEEMKKLEEPAKGLLRDLLNKP